MSRIKELLGPAGMVFSVRKDKPDYRYYHYSYENYIKTLHLLILLLWWYGKKCYQINYQRYNNNKSTAFEVKLISQGTSNQTSSEQILDNIHKHFACLLPSLAMPHVQLYHNCLLMSHKNSILTIIYLPALITLLQCWLFKKGGNHEKKND